MARTKRARPTLVVVVLALIAAVAGTALAGPTANTSKSAKALAEKALNKADKAKKKANKAKKKAKGAEADAEAAQGAADAAQGTADTALAQATLVCPAATTDVNGLCFEAAPRAAKTWGQAIGACSASGGFLPSNSQLTTAGFALGNVGPTLPTAEWTDELIDDGSFKGRVVGFPTAGFDFLSTPHPFRCVFVKVPSA